MKEYSHFLQGRKEPALYKSSDGGADPFGALLMGQGDTAGEHYIPAREQAFLLGAIAHSHSQDPQILQPAAHWVPTYWCVSLGYDMDQLRDKMIGEGGERAR